ncbi:hypothetical protein HDU93_003686 [Gonapodya sp. JEL0774]|nr:hypothetical protein HDU93_003686 [Gonapodya sp. JEL0774]
MVISPLEAAAYAGTVQTATALLDLGASVDGETWSSQLPLLRACTSDPPSRLPMATLLLARGADSTQPNDLPLITCVDKGDLAMVRLLLSHGANVDAKQGFALGLAAQRGHLDVAKALVDHGADVGVNDNWALWSAVRHGGLEVVEFLVEKGADPKAPSQHKQAAVKLAKEKGHVDVMKFLRVQARGRRSGKGTPAKAKGYNRGKRVAL